MHLKTGLMKKNYMNDDFEILVMLMHISIDFNGF